MVFIQVNEPKNWWLVRVAVLFVKFSVLNIVSLLRNHFSSYRENNRREEETYSFPIEKFQILWAERTNVCFRFLYWFWLEKLAKTFQKVSNFPTEITDFLTQANSHNLERSLFTCDSIYCLSSVLKEQREFVNSILVVAYPQYWRGEVNLEFWKLSKILPYKFWLRWATLTFKTANNDYDFCYL